MCINTRNQSLDILRVVLAAMVVAIHTSFLADLSPLAAHLTSQGLFRIAVPVFFISSGYFFVDSVDRGQATQWMKRILLLYLFWMFFYAYFWVRPAGGGLAGLAAMVPDALFGFFHLWYLSAALGAGVLVYLVHRYKIAEAYLIAAVLFTFIGGVSLEYLGEYISLANPTIRAIVLSEYVRQNFLFFGLPFFAGGYLIRRHALGDRVSLHAAIALSAIGLLLLLVESYVHYRYSLRRGWFENMASLIVAAPSVFILVTKIHVPGRTKDLARYSVGIYLIHVFLIRLVQYVVDIPNTIRFTGIILALSAAASFVFIRLARRVSFVL